jgi:SAM-dependent methyltransferase
MSPLVSPTSGRPLAPDGPFTLTDGTERWPVLDGIAYLRVGREALVGDALARIDAGDADGALCLLLADQDDWWDGPPPHADDLARLVREREALSLRSAMDLLGYGRVGHYFAHRWSDPTFMAGLALVDAHWREPESALELACGIGHYLRELLAAGVAVCGGDVVFSKLWLARHWVAGAAELVCFDARAPWPVAGRRFDLVLCQDAFYFLEPKAEILERLRAIAAGPIALAHIHNRDAANLSAGAAVSADDIARMFPDALVYDDAALTRAAAHGTTPAAQPPGALRQVEAFSVLDRPSGPVRSATGPLNAPKADTAYRRNPLYRATPTGAAVAWPSERYGAEYGPLATYPGHTDLPEYPASWTAEQVRRREVVALPERW